MIPARIFIFCRPGQLQPIGEIMAELDDLDAALAKLEKELEL